MKIYILIFSSFIFTSCTKDYKQEIWSHRVNDLSRINNLKNKCHGFEIDIYYDSSSQLTYLIHDNFSKEKLSQRNTINELKKIHFNNNSLWFDLKNNSIKNQGKALASIIENLNKIKIKNIYIESYYPKILKKASRAGFKTLFTFTPRKLNKIQLLREYFFIKRSNIDGLAIHYKYLLNNKLYYRDIPIFTFTVNNKNEIDSITALRLPVKVILTDSLNWSN
ncbi:hypothetical protein [Flammeovirga kamogawensis]|uniref:Glycerophosphodiester phosphodiesterase n=1 Tax=Flammeovirga kamogawensis TaxID=373891 RepID=A0ABX8GSQ1_9BACT|nr:hypothetical protein [Flammeovirga kamogawensis]MBB6464078.1 hypothetical protein [Flammeovirga kamogawensis]QWG06551.1 hypothetical protein KM029_14650 [Flammeovirga kamogawensis]TRX68378.1 hypothetical protein EO216_09655 [Flammeovirga kamogawensis]